MDGDGHNQRRTCRKGMAMTMSMLRSDVTEQRLPEDFKYSSKVVSMRKHENVTLARPTNLEDLQGKLSDK